MDNTKKKISLFTMAIALLVFLSIVILTNVLLNNYVGNRAQESIQSVRSSFDEDYVESSQMSDNEIFLMVDTLEVPITNEESEIQQRYLSRIQRKIILEVVSGDYLKDSIREIEIDGYNYYFTYFNNPYVEISEQDVGSPEIILYTDVTPYKKLIETMNLIYGVALIALVLGSYFLGVRMGKDIEDSQEKLKQFYQNASHELKTPIMSIQGYAEGIKLGIIKDTDKAMDIIMDESDKMAHLVEELLYISKLDSGQIVFKREDVSIYDLVVDILSSYTPEIKRRNLRINLDIENGISASVDEREFSRAVGNIISNAVRFAEREISIVGKRTRSKMVLEIFNDGERIIPEELEKIFDRFFIGNKGNTGIGLSMSMDIINLHKGSLRAENRDSGVCFTIEI